MSAGSGSFVRRSDPLAAEVDGETVMFHATTGAYYGMGGVGSRVWALLEQRRTLDELCERLTAEYAVEPAACRADVKAFLERLVEAELVTEGP